MGRAGDSQAEDKDKYMTMRTSHHLFSLVHGNVEKDCYRMERWHYSRRLLFLSLTIMVPTATPLLPSKSIYRRRMGLQFYSKRSSKMYLERNFLFCIVLYL